MKRAVIKYKYLETQRNLVKKESILGAEKLNDHIRETSTMSRISLYQAQLTKQR